MTWQPINLRHLEKRPTVKPGRGGLIYPSKRHVFSGPPESAKTLAVYAIALEEVRDHGAVLLIDFEMGQWDARDRLREMGASDDDLNRISYIEPEEPADDHTCQRLVDEWEPTLVIIDAAAGAYDLQRLDDHKRVDAETFARMFIRGFWLRNVATIVLDHVVKNAGARGSYAIGSERKIGGADVHLGFETVLPIQRGGRGLYRITTHKDRPGYLTRPKAAELELRSDPTTHAITWEFRAASPADAGTAWRPTVLMEKVSRWLEQVAAHATGFERDEVTRKDVETNVRGRAQFVRVALDELIRDDYVQETAGSRGSRLVRSLRPYRESDVVPPRPDVVPDPSVALDRRRPSSHPLGVDEDEDDVGGEHRHSEDAITELGLLSLGELNEKFENQGAA